MVKQIFSEKYWDGLYPEIKKLYLQGYSAREVKEILHIQHGVKRVQTILKKWGLIRSVGDSFRLAVKRGVVKYKRTAIRHQINLTKRYEIMKRDNFTCVLCGNTAKDNVRLEVDHIISPLLGGTNDEDNLRTLCQFCNLGRVNVEQKKEILERRRRLFITNSN